MNSGENALIQASDTLNINTHDADINNTDGATLFGFNSLVLTTAQAIKNMAGYIQSAFNITLNALTLDNDQDASVIAQGGTLDANVSSLSNQGLLFADDVDIDSDNFSNSGQSAQIQATSHLDINNSNHIYNQSGALIYSAGNVSLSTVNNVYNTSSIIEAVGNLNISANTIENQQQAGADESFLYSGNTMTLTGNVNNDNSNIQSSADLSIVNGDFTNNAGGAVKAKNGTATFDVGNWTNYGFIGAYNLDVTAENALNQGDKALVMAGSTMLDGSQFSFTTTSGGLSNKGGAVIYSFGSGSFDIAGTLLNESSFIETNGALILSSNYLVNEKEEFEVIKDELEIERINGDISTSEIENKPGGLYKSHENSTTMETTYSISKNSNAAMLLSGGNMQLKVGNDITNGYSLISSAGKLHIEAKNFFNKIIQETDTIIKTGVYTLYTRSSCSWYENCSHKNHSHHTRNIDELIYSDLNIDESSTVTAGGSFTGSFSNLENGSVLSIENRADEEVAIKDASSELTDNTVKNENLPDTSTDDVTDLGSEPDQVSATATSEDPLIKELDDIDPSELSADLSDTTLDDLTSSALFSQVDNSDHNYLIETNPNFTDYQNFISSDYMLEKWG